MYIITKYYVISKVFEMSMNDGYTRINYNKYWENDEGLWDVFNVATCFDSYEEAHKILSELLLDIDDNNDYTDMQINEIFNRNFVR